MVLLFLVVFGIITLSMVFIFSGTGAKEIVNINSMNENYSSAMSGMERARYELVRPDDPTQAYKYTGSYDKSFTLNIDNNQVNVSIKDVTWTGN